MKKKKIHKHKINYDYDRLALKNKALSKYIFIDNFGLTKIDFTNQQAIIELNKAIIYQELNLVYWDLPQDNLCPTYDSRKNYIDFIKEICKEKNLKGIDIGTGASLIYPLIGTKKYNWTFIGTDICQKSLDFANTIIDKNGLQEQIQVRLQKDNFFSFIGQEDKYNFCMCNPPYFSDISQKRVNEANILMNEAVTEGGETQFFKSLFEESLNYKKNIQWFTCLLGIKQNYDICRQFLQEKKTLIYDHNPIFIEKEISQGKNRRWILAWQFQLIQ